MRRHPSFSNPARLAHQIREAMWLGSAAALVIAVPACGAKVAVDTGGVTAGTGGSGGEGSVGSSGTTSSSGSFTCDEPASPGNVITYLCIPVPNDGCPAADSAAALQALGTAYNEWSTCPEDPEFCSCGKTVVAVPCGPDPAGIGCCYYAEQGETKICEGRPFIVDGRARTADVIQREGFAAAVHPDIAELDPKSRAALADAWATDARHEHASVASFARFVLELLALGAPADLVRAAQQAIGDEIRHAELCFGIASSLAATPLGPAPLPMENALGNSTVPAAIAAAVVREGCVGETLSALGALEARDAATDPAVRAALAEIAEDEAAHAALAWRTVAWMWAAGDASVRAAITRAFAESGPPAVEADLPDIDPDTARAFGRLPAAERHRAAIRGLAEIVQPSAAALFTSAVTSALPAPPSARRAASPDHT